MRFLLPSNYHRQNRHYRQNRHPSRAYIGVTVSVDHLTADGDGKAGGAA